MHVPSDNGGVCFVLDLVFREFENAPKIFLMQV